MTNIPRLMIASTKGKSGKTIISLALMFGLKSRGLKVQPFKVGPDFIDPSYHALLTGIPPRTLDSIMFNRDILLQTFGDHGTRADISVIEGVFGLYDSPDGLTERGSSAEVAKMLRCPIILVVDAERTNRGLLALIRGFSNFDPDVQIRGIVLNRVGTKRQEEKIRAAVNLVMPEIEVLGSVPRTHIIEDSYKYRHLGLIPTAERTHDVENLNDVAKTVAGYLNIDRLKEIAQAADHLTVPKSQQGSQTRTEANVCLIRDKAFSFYYPENVEYMEAHASHVYYLDAFTDSELPNVDLLYISGGFPEMYAAELQKNQGLKKSIRAAHSAGMQIYAECGGLMYLTKSITDTQGRSHEMVGLIDGDVRMEKKPVGHGYVKLESATYNPLAPLKVEVIGHEFHHSRLALRENPTFAFRVIRGYGIDGANEGILKKGLLAMYSHLHVLHNPRLFQNLLATATNSRRINSG